MLPSRLLTMSSGPWGFALRVQVRQDSLGVQQRGPSSTREYTWGTRFLEFRRTTNRDLSSNRVERGCTLERAMQTLLRFLVVSPLSCSEKLPTMLS